VILEADDRDDLIRTVNGSLVGLATKHMLGTEGSEQNDTNLVGVKSCCRSGSARKLI
jgi:hypothetical protein